MQPGGGCITLSLHGARAVFSELSSMYPLKLLSPYVHDRTAIVYLLTYGGGLVGGDEVNLVVNIQPGAQLVILSQGSTKVFKSRPGRRLASVKPFALHFKADANHQSTPIPSTRQNINFHVAQNSTLFLLPEPVTCFRDASYNQYQRFYIEEGGSAVILDWITSGRMSMGEEWAFSHYHSVNEIFHDGKRMAKDVMLLDNEGQGDTLPERTLRQKLLPYSCYAMLVLYGPQLQSVAAEITGRYDQISVFKTRIPDPVLWSLSPMDRARQGLIIRVAGIETEAVKFWLKQTLSGLEEIVGKDVFRRAFT
ncbi:UreD-domain-containing protein [Gymnopilus junonius]|uniref:UreD-domain-containing protein n=1 Tax=Gymnopilus junonius TaxID=109634 RepID=A0A9P5TV81_GYMJU|nr:UreD-domain-containing protein [Gymnopilus junonius]